METDQTEGNGSQVGGVLVKQTTAWPAIHKARGNKGTSLD